MSERVSVRVRVCVCVCVCEREREREGERERESGRARDIMRERCNASVHDHNSIYRVGVDGVACKANAQGVKDIGLIKKPQRCEIVDITRFHRIYGPRAVARDALWTHVCKHL